VLKDALFENSVLTRSVILLVKKQLRFLGTNEHCSGPYFQHQINTAKTSCICTTGDTNEKVHSNTINNSRNVRKS
jgi:hypothetical protein